MPYGKLSRPTDRISRFLNRVLFRRNAAFVGAIFATAFAFEFTYDDVLGKVWRHWNRGRYFEDVKHRFVQEE